MSLRSALREISPPWLRADVSERVMHPFGIVLDVVTEWAWQGMRSRFPGVAPADALPVHGRDRRIVRGITEGAAPFAERLRIWLDSWSIAGSSLSVLRQLRGYLSASTPALRIVDNSGNWTELDGADVVTRTPLGSWDWDGDSTSWWRYWPIVDSSAGPFASEGTWGDGATWGDGGTWGTTATPEQVANLRALLRRWAGAHAVPQWVIVSLDGAHFVPGDPGPDGTWGTWSKNVAGTQVPTRHGGARYMDGA